MRFGDWLREKRLERGWRQADVAKRAGVSLSYISAIERGERHHLSDSPTLPKRDVVIAIARALGEDVTETLMIAGYQERRKAPKFYLWGYKPQIALWQSN